jgi:hypothetical protein
VIGANTWPRPRVEVTMRSVVRKASLVLFVGLLLLAPGLHAQTDAGTPVPVDATMETMRTSGTLTLSAERGHRVVVLFYEDRDHIDTNAAFKGDLEQFVIDNHLEDRVVTYGVANLADVGMVPHAFVRQMIAPLLERLRSDILLDWDGVMRRDPFSFATAATTCAIIDRTGAITYRYTGAMDEAHRRSFYSALRRAIAAH